MFGGNYHVVRVKSESTEKRTSVKLCCFILQFGPKWAYSAPKLKDGRNIILVFFFMERKKNFPKSSNYNVDNCYVKAPKVKTRYTYMSACNAT